MRLRLSWKGNTLEDRREADSCKAKTPYEPTREEFHAERHGIDRLPQELILQIFFYLGISGLFNLKLAGSRYLTTSINSLARPSLFDYVLELQLANPGYHPTQIAATRGHEALLIALFEDHSIEILWNETSFHYGKSKLHWAADIGRIKTVKQLLLDATRLDSKDSVSRTPLHWAAANGHEETVKLLLESRTLRWGVKNGQKARYVKEDYLRRVVGFDSAMKTPLYLAAENGHIEAVRALMEKGDRGPNGANVLSESSSVLRKKNALDLAAENGHMEVVRLLLTSPDIRTYSWTRYHVEKKALYWAAEKNQIATAKLLLDQLHSIEASRNIPLSEGLEGPEVIITAIENGHSEMIKLLLERKVNVPRSALKAAAEKRRLEILGMLLDWGHGKWRAYGEEDKVALLWAASNGEVNIVKLLMSRGAFKYGHAVDRAGTTPLHCAACANINVTWKGLSEYWPNSTPRGYSYGHKQVIEYLLSHGEVSVEETDVGWMTALHYAADGDRGISDPSGAQSGLLKEIVKLLIDHGADRMAKDWNYRLPLHFAAANGNTELFSLLLPQMRYINATDQNGKTPLHYAIDGFRPNHNPYGKGRPSMVKFLLDQGADKDAQDEDGRTPMHFAAWELLEDIFDLLQIHGADLWIKDKNGLTPAYVLADQKGWRIAWDNRANRYEYHDDIGGGYG